MTATAPTGAELRDRALDRLRRTRAVLVRSLQRVAVQLALDPNRDDVTSDDLRALVPIPPGIDARVVGAGVRGLAEAGILTRAGYRPSTRPVAHHRPMAVWLLDDADAARLWLATHPALDDIDADSGE